VTGYTYIHTPPQLIQQMGYTAHYFKQLSFEVAEMKRLQNFWGFLSSTGRRD
jgi:hypothetical protein